MNQIATALYGTLTADGTLTGMLSGTAAIYRTQAVEGAALPYVVFSQYAGGPLNISPSDLRDSLYFIRGYGTTMAQAGSIDARMSADLHKGTLTVGGGYSNYSLLREEDIELPEELPNGQIVFMSGGIYRISLDS
ncbi:MAG: hypothetical protein KKH95_04320 [Gammaproteobacteria bacterium]|nr:hypothetical protein [Gammaproteobacteria bacterium]